MVGDFNKNKLAERIDSLLPRLRWLDGKNNEMLDLVIKLCNVNSGTYNLAGLQSVAGMLIDEFGRLGGEIKILDVDEQRSVSESGVEIDVELGKLIQIVKRPEIRPRVLLCIHMDTVYPAESPFQICRRSDNETIIGPGVADAKGGLIVMLYSLLAVEQSGIADSIGWEVIINPDEELGSPGSARFLHERAKLADIGLLFEPKLPDGTLVSTRKGVGNFSFIIRGIGAHSGRDFASGRNAIVACCEMMSQLDRMNESDDVTINIGKISGGTALNVVPDLAIGRINVRVQTEEQASELERKFQAAADELSMRDGISVQMFGGFTSPPKIMTSDLGQLQERIEICGRSLGQDIRWKPTGGASDGNKFAGAGLVNIDTLGPLGGEIHSFNEYLNPESLVPSAKLAAMTMLSLVNPSDP